MKGLFCFSHKSLCSIHYLKISNSIESIQFNPKFLKCSFLSWTLLLKVPILQGFAYHKYQPGEAGSHKLITGLSFPCSIYDEAFMGTHLSSNPSFPSVNSGPAAAKLACAAHSKRAGIYPHTLGTVPQNLTAGLVLSQKTFSEAAPTVLLSFQCLWKLPSSCPIFHVKKQLEPHSTWEKFTPTHIF